MQWVLSKESDQQGNGFELWVGAAAEPLKDFTSAGNSYCTPPPLHPSPGSVGSVWNLLSETVVI